MRLQILALIPAAVLALSCAGVGNTMGDPHRGTFERAVDYYAKLVRWNRIDEAGSFIDPEVRGQWARYKHALRDMRLTDVSIGKNWVDPRNGDEVVQLVYRGYWLSAPFERELPMTQRWRRDATTQLWYVRPDFEALAKML
jgi:hypothetical protein